MRLFDSTFNGSLFTLAIMGLLFFNSCQNQHSEAGQNSNEKMSDEKNNTSDSGAEQQKQFLTTLSSALSTPPRTPMLHKPDEYGMDYEEIIIETADGVKLNGWFIPAKSKKLIICNHFSPANRAGFPGHQEPFTYAGGFEVNFLPKYKALHDAGYNVLAYDMRCHGQSETGKEGGFRCWIF